MLRRTLPSFSAASATVTTAGDFQPQASQLADVQAPVNLIPVQIEALVRDGPMPANLRQVITDTMCEYVCTFKDHTFTESDDICKRLKLERLTVCVRGDAEVSFFRAHLELSVFQFARGESMEHVTCDPQDGSRTSIFTLVNLPCRDLDGLWESLMMAPGVKDALLSYAATTLLFSDRGVDANLVSANRMLLLHRPPGTGKTSLCKALAQKLAVRLAGRYTRSCLVDVSAHAIFSRWFSESGKMVGKLFETIQALASDPDVLVCVLVDEVESLAASRTRTSAGSDPSDATRVVNAMLTQLDRLKSRANVLLLTTSNVTEVLDAAFLDRADVKLFIAHPTEEARYELLRSATLALLRVGVVLAPPSAGQSDVLPATLQAACTQCAQSPGALLSAVAKASEGLSGRALRKLPLLAYAKHLGASSTLAAPPSLEGFARAMLAAVQQELAALVKSL